MARGYLANWFNVPPLVFRFQINPELLQEKKGYKYEEADFGCWGFDLTRAAAKASTSILTKLVATPMAAYEDLKELGPRITRTKPLQATGGEQRTFALDFQLDSRVSGEGVTVDIANPYGGTIEPDLALLRSFMYPSLDPIALVKLIADWSESKANEVLIPPTCTLIYGGLNVDCVMEALNIKITRFNEDHTPQRAEISVSLKQQTKSISPILETVSRIVDVAKSYGREGWGEDYLNVLPGVGTVRHIFEL